MALTIKGVKATTAKRITTNEIAAGVIFLGRIRGKQSGVDCDGLFLRCQTNTGDPYTVFLGGSAAFNGKVFKTCHPVENFQEVNATLTVEASK